MESDLIKKYGGLISVIFGIIACILVFSGAFKNPPVPITIFAILSIISGAVSFKFAKTTSIIGLLLSIVSLGYLIYLFAGLGA